MTTPTQGFCEAAFQPLLDAFRANFDEGLEIGASMAVTHHGRLVVDLWPARVQLRLWSALAEVVAGV